MPSYVQKVQNSETLAAIDLGSNALRAVIARRRGGEVRIIKSFREPLRLGEDVFSSGNISPQKMALTEEAFIKLFYFFSEYNVTKARAVATSAMRESKNAQVLADKIASYTGIQIETITGDLEAELICNAVKGQVNLKKKTAILMDIGGGSTELTIVKNEKVLAAQSFNVGTVRLLSYQNQAVLEGKITDQLGKMITFIEAFIKIKDINLMVGTGGNLRRIGKIRKKMLGKESSEFALLKEIEHMKETITSMSYIERIRKLEMDQNRADVILPAILMTHHLMEALKINKIHLPKVGLKEGIILSLLDEPPKKMILKD